MKLVPKKWSEFQHYKDRSPPWIKLHRNILDNRKFIMLSTASKALVPMLWLLASEDKNGEFDADLEELEFRTRMSKRELSESLNELIEKGFFLDASTMLSPCLHDAIPETEREVEAKTEGKTKKEVETSMSGKPDPAISILNHLNSTTGRGYKPVDANLKLIRARIKEGHSVSDIIRVVDRKCKEWPEGHKMHEYLRPATLFNAEKFNNYVGQIGIETPEERNARETEEWINGHSSKDENVIEGEVIHD